MTTPPITPLDREAAALLPCPTPWCSGADKPYIWQGPDDLFCVICAVCQVEGPSRDTEVEAEDAWNTRTASERATSPAGDAGEVERIAKLCETYAAAAGTSDEDTERPFEDGMTLAGYTLAGMIRDRFSAALRPRAGDAGEVERVARAIALTTYVSREEVATEHLWFDEGEWEDMGEVAREVYCVTARAVLAALLPQAGDADVVGEPGA